MGSNDGRGGGNGAITFGNFTAAPIDKDVQFALKYCVHSSTLAGLLIRNGLAWLRPQFLP